MSEQHGVEGEAVAGSTDMSLADRFGVGPGRDRRHAVDLLEALPAIDAGVRAGRLARDVEVFGVCGERVTLARKWGRFEYGNPQLNSRRCERCGWIVALYLGSTGQEIDYYRADPTDRALILAGGNDPDLMPNILSAVLARYQGQAPDPEPGFLSDLLAHICRHRPIAVICEQCWDGGAEEAHGPGVMVCPESAVACWSCTFIAGAWAGEHEGGIGSCECVVTAPCSVLAAVAAHHGISVTAGGFDERR
ncbi:hypothetical protein [Mycolicibacterium palauense]|uniref:hypothetical protein n=1 Tax=Mycolicibacterium palauense TaxID=2034511 RepID=UPI0011453A1D|nr:hypothetical protein [Mycolicibacterium palauense]